MFIRVDYQPSEWQCVWLYPTRPNHLFSKIQVWDWQRVHSQDDKDFDDEIRRASEDDEE